ncbi:hypothetical protein ABZW47_29455 [Streptomyces sp. NPDC004549]|uniref:hypothetical protein n=1 Tax=Streptomyces sp. NPDC004549 TaxID=3154283 RepID=UPI0033B53B0A
MPPNRSDSRAPRRIMTVRARLIVVASGATTALFALAVVNVVPAWELLYGSASRAQRRWGDDADADDIRRPHNGQHVVCGGGPHLCAGIRLAELRPRSVLRALAARCPQLTLDGEPVGVVSNLLRGYSVAPLAVELTPCPYLLTLPARQTGACQQGPVT